MEAQQQRAVESSLIKFKIQAIFIIAFVVFAGGLVPMRRPSTTFLSLGNTFSGGVFLAAGFLHMLAESVQGFSEIKKDSTFPYAYFWCIVGILIPMFVEKILMQRHHHDHGAGVLVESATPGTHSTTTPLTSTTLTTHSSFSTTKRVLTSILIVITLSIHSLIEGKERLMRTSSQLHFNSPTTYYYYYY
jgi:zinc transporter ZupT